MNHASGDGSYTRKCFERVTCNGQRECRHVFDLAASQLQERLDFDFFDRHIVQPGQFPNQAGGQHALDHQVGPGSDCGQGAYDRAAGIFTDQFVRFFLAVPVLGRIQFFACEAEHRCFTERFHQFPVLVQMFLHRLAQWRYVGFPLLRASLLYILAQQADDFFFTARADGHDIRSVQPGFLTDGFQQHGLFTL